MIRVYGDKVYGDIVILMEKDIIFINNLLKNHTIDFLPDFVPYNRCYRGAPIFSHLDKGAFLGQMILFIF